MATYIQIGENNYRVRIMWNDLRCFIDYDGLIVLADKMADGTWALSQVPATGYENECLKTLLADNLEKTTTVMTEDPGIAKIDPGSED